MATATTSPAVRRQALGDADDERVAGLVAHEHRAGAREELGRRGVQHHPGAHADQS
jgi:hypothetical protein